MKFKILYFSLLILLLLFSAFPALSTGQGKDTNGDGVPDQWIIQEEEDITCVKTDRNYDGTVDYIYRFNSAGNKVEELVDYNHDGEMDDFYYYSRGVLVRQEIDSNYDGKIDIWVYLKEGIYVERFERDEDYDGEVDVVQKYGEEEKDKKEKK